MEWPRFVLFKSLQDDKYLCSRNQRMCFTDVKDLGWDAAHEVVMAKCGGGLVHISNNGQYWRAVDNRSTQYFVAGAADEPEENKTGALCTLFKPSFHTKDGVNITKLQHFYYGQCSFVYVNPSGICVGGMPTGEGALSVIAVSWVPLMIKYLKQADLEVIVSDRKKRLPGFVVFKSAHNNKYLRCDEDEPNLLRFNGQDAMNPHSKHEVVMAKSVYGLVHIKCCSTGKYWRRLSEDDHWIVAEADETEEDLSKWSCTLFWLYYDPKEGDNAVQLQHSQLGTNTSIFQNCLTARKSPQTTTQKVGFVAFDWESLFPKSPQYPSVDEISVNTGGGVSNDGIDTKIEGGISVDDINKIVGGLAIEDHSNTIIVGGVSIKISEVVYQLKARFVESSTTRRVE